ncbi:hypothetical protein HYPSUDRAFT_47786 [Hypholoma sublateritium FD-334 SS-4]|uniref:N-acetyltransferase domain-containing protein n=1 Tax=Hypholoma sublateritium (strain FD-334 SS-4) TaxID=945553 RepID=A0A0D2NHB9_HYPSF|nr:hypothetical protein HYPSUDRAFT_47786 [Hypholoma sublateritium FD-334 SS-4]
MSGQRYYTNFCYSLPKTLQSDRVSLVPFIPEEHAQLFVDEAPPDIYKYLPFGPFTDGAELITDLFNVRVRDNPGYVLFAIYDKTRAATPTSAGAFAGIIGLINSDPVNLSTEISFVMILPAFQRTHVASHAVGILLHCALDTAPRGLGLRRVVWQAFEQNAPSVRLAQRMGFVPEGVMRWARVLQPSKTDAGNAIAVRDGDPQAKCAGANVAVLSLTWDDWELEWRDKVDGIMARVSVSQ